MGAFGNRFRALHEDEKGLSLVEVLTAFLIISMIMSILYTFLLMGITMYKRITVETQLRNQANYMFSKVIDSLRDAVYVEFINDKQVLVVKRSSDSDEYVHEYTLAFTARAFTVTDAKSSKQTVYELSSDKFKMDAKFENTNLHDMVAVNIVFDGEPADAREAEKSHLQIDRKIPLFRNE